MEQSINWVVDSPKVRGFDGKTLAVFVDERRHIFRMHVTETAPDGTTKPGFVLLALEPEDLEAALHMDTVMARLKQNQNL